MRKECRTLYGLLVVLIIFGVTLPALGQQSNTESNILQYTGKVDLPKLIRKVDNLSQSVDTLTKNQESLLKDVGELKVTIARIDERTSNILTIVIGGIIGLFVTIAVGALLQIIFLKKQMIQYFPQ